MPDDVRQDPTFHATQREVTGRDGCRVPMPWTHDGPSLGFGPGDHPWLPQPEAYAGLAVDQQDGVEGSTLELYARCSGCGANTGSGAARSPGTRRPRPRSSRSGWPPRATPGSSW